MSPHRYPHLRRGDIEHAATVVLAVVQEPVAALGAAEPEIGHSMGCTAHKDRSTRNEGMGC